MKTVSLELAKQLKDAGYPQYPYFTWSNWHYGELVFGKGKENFQGEYEVVHIPCFNDPENQFAAPTADEMLNRLPGNILGRNLQICRSFSDGWFVGYGDHMNGYGYKVVDGETLADAAAQMWLYLKKEGLL